MNRVELDKTLRVMSKAWGRNNPGYVFLPWIDRQKQQETGLRRAGYNEGPAFYWPRDKDKIIDHMASHEMHDLYWCPVVFEEPARQEQNAGPEYCLWADLDDVDPNLIEDYPPSIAWETSPDRFQALWLMSYRTRRAMSAPGMENQRLTYYLGADKSGWDSTQLLRVPGWVNHKPEYKKNGEFPRGKLLWTDGRQYEPDEFDDLPEVEFTTADVSDAIEFDIEHIDRHKVIARVKLKLNKRARAALSATQASGDVSNELFYLMRCLADVGCSLAEIVAVTRETVWNKFEGRADEMKRLITEAGKAISQRSEAKTQEVEEELDQERPDPDLLVNLLRNIKPPKFMVSGVFTEGVCGFIAGEPKTYKSWVAFDLALSVASGRDFLNYFRVDRPGPVFYVQEEDPAILLKERSTKIWSGKSGVKLWIERNGSKPELWGQFIEGGSDLPDNVTAYIQRGLVISDPAWQLWLDEQMEKKRAEGEPYRLIVIDTLMMVAGEVDENKSQEMTTHVYKPLKVLSRKHDVAVIVVHHMGKGEKPRSGQRLLGGVANHAWSEDSLYLMRAGQAGNDVRIELESKYIPANTWRMTNINNREWDPHVEQWTRDEPDDNKSSQTEKNTISKLRFLGKDHLKLYYVIRDSSHPLTSYQLAKMNLGSRRTIDNRLKELARRGLILKHPDKGYTLP